METAVAETVVVAEAVVAVAQSLLPQPLPPLHPKQVSPLELRRLWHWLVS